VYFKPICVIKIVLQRSALQFERLYGIVATQLAGHSMLLFAPSSCYLSEFTFRCRTVTIARHLSERVRANKGGGWGDKVKIFPR